LDALGVVGEATIKKVLYHWMLRATHESLACLDCIIPSWVDFDELTTFFHRQLISENRKGVNPSSPGAAMVSIESLKEAESTMAVLCHGLAKEVADFGRRMEEELPHDWSDGTVGVNASDILQNGGGSMAFVDWANHSQVYLPALTFTKLRDRYVGPSNRILTSIFSAKLWYETTRLISADTSMDFRLPPTTQNVLATEASVSAELWSDSFSALSSNVFWGHFCRCRCSIW
jgi:hypothetical protein